MQGSITHLGRALVLGCALGLAGAAQAAVVFENLGSGAPPASVGGIAVTPFDLTPQEAIADFDTISTIPGSPVPGDLTVAPVVEKLTMPDTWTSVWSNGYIGPVFSSDGEDELTLNLPPNTTAFYFHAEPGNYGTFTITATSDSGITSGPVSIVAPSAPPTGNEIPGLAFHTTTVGEAITSITVTAEAGAGGFAIAQFGIGTNEPAPPAPTVTAVPTLGEWSLLLLGLAAAGLGASRLRRRG